MERCFVSITSCHSCQSILTPHRCMGMFTLLIWGYLKLQQTFNQFDAPIGYPSITANYMSEWRQWWFAQDNVRLYQFMGKDNVYFHTIYFPSMLLGDGRPWTTLHHLSTTGLLSMS